MELRVLNYFLTVAREGGLTRASEVLHVTQPTMSRQIQELDVWGNLKTGHVDQRKMGHCGPKDYPLFIAWEELYRVSAHDMSAEKMKLICEKKEKETTNEAPPIEDRISRIAQNSLSKYDMLREIQSAESMREVS